jgi:hypothetical protein
MYSIRPFCTISWTVSRVPCTALITAAASWLKVCARPVPQLNTPETSRRSSSHRFTSTTSST